MKRLSYLLPVVLIVPLLVVVLHASHAQTNRQVAYLTVSTAKVEVMRTETNRWAVVNTESIVGVGDRIRTDASGNARIAILGGNAVLSLEPNTEIVINALDDTETGFSTSIAVNSGVVTQSASVTAGMDTAYELVAPSMVVVLRAGSVDVQVHANGDSDLLATVGSTFVFAGGQVKEVTAGSGIRAKVDGSLTDVLPVSTFQQLSAGLDGATASFSSPSDVRLNVRNGPSRDQTTIGTLDPTTISTIHGISADGEWYRVSFQNGYGWVNGVGFTVTVQRNLLVVFPNAYIEAPPVSDSSVALSPVTPPPALVEDAAPENLYETAVATALQGNSLEELTMIAELNQWRIDVGLWPLRPNAVLNRMARDQATYLLSLPTFPDDTHKDGKGRYPRERAVSSEYGWPSYGVSARVSVGENVYVGANVRAAINWWRGSSLHNQTVVNRGYREVGVAALPHRFGSLYVVVFGGRPNIFPSMVEPLSNTLLLSQEGYQYAPGGDWIGEVKQYQFLPTVLTQINDGAWQGWTSQTTIPQNGSFVVAYADGNKRVLIEINPVTDVVWLPSNLPSPELMTRLTAAPPTVTPAAPPVAIIPTALPTNTPFR